MKSHSSPAKKQSTVIEFALKDLTYLVIKNTLFRALAICRKIECENTCQIVLKNILLFFF